MISLALIICGVLQHLSLGLSINFLTINTPLNVIGIGNLKMEKQIKKNGKSEVEETESLRW